MSYWIYSSESLPNPNLMGKPGYTPDAEYIRFSGVHLGVVPARKWTELPESFQTTRKRSWRDAPEPVEVPIRNVKPVIAQNFSGRGVILLDHPPTSKEREDLEEKSLAANLAHRMSCVEWYESQVREKETGGQGRTKPTPYENECYDILGLTKPYSVEAMRAQRHPGEAVGAQIVAALERLEQRRIEQTKQENAAK